MGVKREGLGCPAKASPQCSLLPLRCYRCPWKKTLLLCQPLPYNPEADTAIQPLIWCSDSLSSSVSTSPEEWFFHIPDGGNLGILLLAGRPSWDPPRLRAKTNINTTNKHDETTIRQNPPRLRTEFPRLAMHLGFRRPPLHVGFPFTWDFPPTREEFSLIRNFPL